MFDKLKGYRTVIAGVLSLAVYVLSYGPLKEFIGPERVAEIAAILMFVLRFFTTTPVFSKAAK